MRGGVLGGRRAPRRRRPAQAGAGGGRPPVAALRGDGGGGGDGRAPYGPRPALVVAEPAPLLDGGRGLAARRRRRWRRRRRAPESGAVGDLTETAAHRTERAITTNAVRT